MFGMWRVHTATVEPFLGSGSMGDVYGPPVTVTGYLDDGLVLERTSAGEQLVQKTTFFADLADAAKFPPESKVTVNGRDCQVVSVRTRDAGPLFGAVEHVEVTLK